MHAVSLHLSTPARTIGYLKGTVCDPIIIKSRGGQVEPIERIHDGSIASLSLLFRERMAVRCAHVAEANNILFIPLDTYLIGLCNG